MLHTYFCSLDKGVKKHRPEALKSMKIEFRGPSNPFEKQLQSDTASEEAFEPQFFRKLWFFNDIGLPKRSQNPRKIVENAMLKNNAFFNRFSLEFSSLWRVPRGSRTVSGHSGVPPGPDFGRILRFFLAATAESFLTDPRDARLALASRRHRP